MVGITLSRTLGIFLGLLTAVRAESATCSQVSTGTSIQKFQGLDIGYTSEQLNYWSTACGNLKPGCILVPTSAEEVSAIVKVLGTNNETFAVKSGGHNPNNYYASVKDGPLISTKGLKEVIYDKAGNTVSVGPGNKWEDVHAALDGTGVTVVGGRIGNVGVGGYLLGGGLSFLSTQYGWASNNIVSVEMVLANGTIVTASNTTNPDLLAAIKGGGNAFGIVTRYVLQAHPIGQIWGGNLVFGADKTDTILAAIRNFTENYDDPKAAIIATSELTVLNLVDIWILFLFYDGPEPPANVFKEFLDIGPTINSCKSRSYTDLLTSNNQFVLKGSVYTIATETTPLPSAADGAKVMRSYYDHWYNTSSAKAGVFGMIASIAFQPIPKSLPRIARENGGDLLDLDDDVDRIIFEFDYSYVSQLDDATIDKTMVDLYSGMKTRVDGFIADGTLPDIYRPLFMNDGYFRQDYWGRLKPEKRELAQKVRAEVDPTGMFQQRTGGFRLPA
ncbi:putative FAD-linked oxidoreductase [Colletotrichum fructicola]|uniref:FAD binding domain-containing protein n=1 Tax=Colletotrichum fructicola (strain Nara gc5) TaxID=1213859 RepID=L2G3X2_COLFN|nr:putative FAD-linked oxidoreductase [Colletotrichum fructicola]KAF4484322.1 putative FAD-linked oxidoreductase [Colletotrichum fructicola Nara gc5]KAE9582718.1 putative FAD-linked oxidoreductase [Colletotrichum fructicola]KAF4431067.1 putative FAD-linked oxidoreductase [Colletotrichum fructicola]KAF4895832.1 putative FAD-linked oxidoreductase [Colletotrichum fructicola]KAF4908129.1 putative FAD-linked oxidoreductase [Colletotrichum fructicola]